MVYRTAIVGARRGLHHAKGYQGLKNMKVVALCDKDEERLAAGVRELEVPGYKSYEETLEEERPDIIMRLPNQVFPEPFGSTRDLRSDATSTSGPIMDASGGERTEHGAIRSTAWPTPFVEQTWSQKDDLPAQRAYTQAIASWLSDPNQPHLCRFEIAKLSFDFIMAAYHSALLGRRLACPTSFTDAEWEQLRNRLVTASGNPLPPSQRA